MMKMCCNTEGSHISYTAGCQLRHNVVWCLIPYQSHILHFKCKQAFHYNSKELNKAKFIS
jgi:hypothetical protein